MKVLSEERGIALVFEDQEDLAKVVKDLTTLKLRKALPADEGYPGIYVTSSDELPHEEVTEFVDSVYLQFKGPRG